MDNDNTHTQITYLSRAYTKLHDERYRDATLHGLDFLLTAQLPSGGFPQVWPNPVHHAAYITYNDNATIGSLTRIRAIAQAALAKGIECLLATQYTNQKGKLQGWGQQHDPVTLKPAKARRHELPSLCSTNTAENIRFLMGVKNPAPRVICAIQADAA